MALTAKDIKEFNHLRQQLDTILNSTKNQLLQRIVGYVKAGDESASQSPKKLSEKQDHLLRMQKFR